jgi:diguanylate cyclase (GGDEF)-like protein
MRVPGVAALHSVAFRGLSFLPRGRLLPDALWARRHRWIVYLLAFHAVGLTAFALLQGFGLKHSLLEGALIGAAAAMAKAPGLSRTMRSVAASLGLVTSSALLVHISGGAIEAHFHFFFVLGVLTLYQDWIPFLLAIGYVVIHHGLLGALTPTSVYNHEDAIAHPWRWALIHAAFVVATSAANVVSWRVNEQLLREPLTGLPGRGTFIQRVQAALEKTGRRDEKLAVLFLDLDRFKMLNDSVGHSAGDRMLVAAGGRIVRAAREQDVVARLGGDEFAVLCEGLETEDQAVRIAERIVEELAAPLDIAGLEVSPSASIGIAFAGTGACTSEELIGRADLAMYRAKNERKRYVVFGEAMREEELRTLELEAALRLAVKHQELRLAYQPIVSLTDGEIVGVEALLRWQHPTRGLLPPSEFISAAERTGAIVPIGEWVLREACLEATRWVAGASGRKPYVSVNLSPRQFGSSDLVGTVIAVLEQTGLPPNRLALEVTESLFMEDCDKPAETLRTLEHLGMAIVLDDFGTGYSSLSYLNRFPISQLKLDSSFVARLGEGDQQDAVPTAIAGMAKALGMTLVAEGVESEKQVAALRLLGLRFAQGYYFARPQSADSLNQRLDARARGEAKAERVARAG